MKNVYIFRGAPASGKSTLVPEFCKMLPSPVAMIEQDKFRWGFHLIGRKVPDVGGTEHAFAHQNALLIYEQYLKNGSYDIVLEGLFTYGDKDSNQGNVQELVDLADQYGFTSRSIVLKADKDKLFARNTRRDYSVPPEEFEELYAGVYGTIDPSEIIIDSTNQGKQETLEQLRDLIG